MNRPVYQIVSELTEDRLDEADTLDEAVRLARGLAADAPAGDAVIVELDGRVVRRWVRAATGVVEEPVGGPAARGVN